jgi:phage terminase small subunit
MGLPKRLTERQIKFAYELVTNDGKMNGKEAAMAAGYSQDRASVTASELQNANIYPLVCEYIEKLRTEKSEQNKLMLRDNLFKLNRTPFRHMGGSGKVINGQVFNRSAFKNLK